MKNVFNVFNVLIFDIPSHLFTSIFYIPIKYYTHLYFYMYTYGMCTCLITIKLIIKEVEFFINCVQLRLI